MRHTITLSLGLFGLAMHDAAAQDMGPWKIHDMSRPAPAVVTPGASAGLGTKAPSDAIVLFDGKDLSRWRSSNGGGPAKWAVKGDYIEVVPGSGPMETAQPFGDCQLHIEWSAPPPKGTGQERGNSGVFLMGRYEVQVLDSYQNATYPDGQAAAVYGQYPPLVNVTRPPGEWQGYDIVFHGPRFAADGKLVRPATVTVFHNGVLVQDNRVLSGPTGHQERPPYAQHPEKLPISLQDHGNTMRFRNVWIRELQ